MARVVPYDGRPVPPPSGVTMGEMVAEDLGITVDELKEGWRSAMKAGGLPEAQKWLKQMGWGK